ncbi:MAG: SRPBCC family protein [Pirellulales bacterium]|nr:SRPBCC family protein [Pirellulales bacterium]
MSKTYHLQRVQLIRRPRDEVFAFFSDAANLEAITPEFLRFQILTPRPIEMRPGTLIDYRLKLGGIPFYWQTRIETFDPPYAFSDLQAKGPYRRWHHWHEFYEVPQGTISVDRVEYELPLGSLGRMARLLFVERNLDQIFEHRRRRLNELLPGVISSETPAVA